MRASYTPCLNRPAPCVRAWTSLVRTCAALALCCVVGVGCAAPTRAPLVTPPAPDPTPADPIDPDIARRPFSPEQIRDAMPVGSWTRFRIEQAGQPSVLNTTTVLSADDTHATLSNQITSEGGAALGQAAEQRVSWRELQQHATFPRADSTLTTVDIDLPSGHWTCWLYSVTDTAEGGGEEVSLFYFAERKPGAPVRYEQTVNGKRVFLMTLIGEGRGNAP